MTTKTFYQIMLAAAIFCFSATPVAARSWRINNNSDKAPDFADLNAACASDEVQAGDTLYMDPGCNLTTEQNVTKGVVIVGVGYEGTLPYSNSIISGRLNMKAEGAKIMSVRITGSLYICANHVTVERCRTTNEIRSSGLCQYATFRQCYISKDGYVINGQGKTITNSAFWTIDNCIIVSYNSYSCSIFGLYSATIRNNLLLNSGSYNANILSDLGGSSKVMNNIIVHTYNVSWCINNCDIQCTNNVISQNYAADTNRITGTTSLADILTGDYDRYTLVENSPAAGYGTDGSDCGIFGGLYPYVKGGLPPHHPYYTKAVISPRAENDKVKVTLNIKMQDE